MRLSFWSRSCTPASVKVGASGYIAAMALFGLAPGTIKPTALVLNVLVSVLVAFRFFRAGHLDWRTFWPLAIASVPAALLGGYLTLPPLFFNRLLGTLLLTRGAAALLPEGSCGSSAAPTS